MVNAELLLDTLARTKAAAAAGRWHQGAWLTKVWPGGDLCGCFAGQRFIADGGTVERVADWWDHGWRLNGESVHPGEHAQVRLGLTDDQASRLFHANNTMADLERIVSELVGGQLATDAEQAANAEQLAVANG